MVTMAALIRGMDIQHNRASIKSEQKYMYWPAGQVPNASNQFNNGSPPHVLLLCLPKINS